jgi:CRISPR-associated protein Cas4
MEDPIAFTTLNDFLFCPASIYYHRLYEGVENLLYTGEKQLKGAKAHEHIEENSWSQSNVICALMVYSDKYGLVGKIDKYYPEKACLVESKRQIKHIYDGYIFQLYAQYFAMKESGYNVERLYLYSIVDHKKYPIKLPKEDKEMLAKFESLINQIHSYDLGEFKPTNIEKCLNCIYSPMCKWGE